MNGSSATLAIEEEMSHAYRSEYQQIVGARLASLQDARERMAPLLPQLRSIHAARWARALAGSVGITGAVAMAVLSAGQDVGGAPTYALLGSSVAAIATYVLARLVVPAATSLSLSTPAPALTGDLRSDLAELDESDPATVVDRRLSRLEEWSTALPMAAISLLTPLTLHYVVAALGGDSASSFAKWIQISLMIVGHAHLTLMGLAIAFARKMTRASREELGRMSIHREWGKALGITVAASAVPGVLLLAVPPVLAAITGLAFVPFMFVFMRRRMIAERAIIDLASTPWTVRVTPELHEDARGALPPQEEPAAEDEREALAERLTISSP